MWITKEDSFKHNEINADFIIGSNPYKPKDQPKQLHYQQPCKTYTKNSLKVHQYKIK